MKMNVTSKVYVDQRLLEEIQSQVEETIAVDMEPGTEKMRPRFGVADLWNIHKQRKQRARRRFL